MHNKQLRPAATSVGEGPGRRQAAENDTPEQDLKRQSTVRRGPSGGPAQGGKGMEQTRSTCRPPPPAAPRMCSRRSQF